MSILPPVPIHRLFLDYIFLNEISKFPEGISGYKLRKSMNEILIRKFKDENHFAPINFSQSLIYRMFKEFKTRNLINEKSIVINNRNQILYSINEKGRNRLEYLNKLIKKIAPIEIDSNTFIENLLSGKISFLELLPKHFPDEQILNILRSIRQRLEEDLLNVNAKINEIEKRLFQQRKKD